MCIPDDHVKVMVSPVGLFYNALLLGGKVQCDKVSGGFLNSHFLYWGRGMGTLEGL